MLHIVNNSGLAWTLCQRFASGDDKVLLIEDGVFAASQCPDELSGQLYVLREDLALRGLNEEFPPGIETVDYAGFVALTTACAKTQSW